MMNNELLYFPRQQFSPRFGDHIFTVDIISHRIANRLDCLCRKSSVVLYKVLIKQGKKEWYIEKRFSEFIYLFDNIKLSPSFRESKIIPTKTWFHSTDKSFLEQREDQLLIALDCALKDLSTQGKQALINSEILEFLLILKK